MFDTGDIARGRTPDPERILTARLGADAERLAFADATPADAASELRALAGGRLDLIAQVAGRKAGLWSVRAQYDGGRALFSAGFLVRALETASLDLDLGRWVEEGRFAAHRLEHNAVREAAFYRDQNRPPGVS